MLLRELSFLALLESVRRQEGSVFGDRLPGLPFRFGDRQIRAVYAFLGYSPLFPRYPLAIHTIEFIQLSTVFIVPSLYPIWPQKRKIRTIAMPEPITLYPNRSKAIWMLLLAVAFVACGIFIGIEGDPYGYLVAAFFGLGIPVFLIQMLPDSAFLTIDEKGIVGANLFQKFSFAWSDIDEFFVVRMQTHGISVHEMVGFNFVSTYDRARVARTLTKVTARCEGALPDTYGMKAADLAHLLNMRLRQAKSETSRAQIST